MLPKKNGFDVLRELRETSKIPVLMLTARGEDMERIVGLEIGADDYLPKTVQPARVSGAFAGDFAARRNERTKYSSRKR